MEYPYNTNPGQQPDNFSSSVPPIPEPSAPAGQDAPVDSSRPADPFVTPEPSATAPSGDTGVYHYVRPQQAPDYVAQPTAAPQNFTSPGYAPTPDPRFQSEPIPSTASSVPPVTPAPAKKKEKKEKKAIRWTMGKVVALVLVCALVGGGAGFGGAMLARGMNPSQSTIQEEPQFPANKPSSGSPAGSSTIYESNRVPATLNVTNVESGQLLTPREVYAANVNSTVGITTSITGTNYWGYPTTSAAAGSGFILTADGYILTNYHVIENSSTITVTTYDNTSYDAVLVGYDESNDIAVLKVEATDLVPVVLGDSDTLFVGDEVIAIGNPLGELTFSLTAGAVSALDREVTLSSNLVMNLIQTDCAINSGNSGGPLFNLYGEVIGITNAKYSSSSLSGSASIDNIGFAIPINSVRDIVTQIIEKGFVSKPYIGVTVGDVSQEAQGYGLPAGAAVQSIVEDSPAAASGLQVNDIITRCNDTEITSSADLVACIGACSVGDELTLSITRKSEALTIQLVVGERIQSAEDFNQQNQQNQQDPQSDPYGDYYGFDPFNFFGFGG